MSWWTLCRVVLRKAPKGCLPKNLCPRKIHNNGKLFKGFVHQHNKTKPEGGRNTIPTPFSDPPTLSFGRRNHEKNYQ